jgi:hypothetical protein
MAGVEFLPPRSCVAFSVILSAVLVAAANLIVDLCHALLRPPGALKISVLGQACRANLTLKWGSSCA